ncbi:NUDIX hydrolase [Craterilacuibacter sinensis]|uniref:Phosphatase NudJ n=1 Tax=Craterilacuibacter sinensis TaxID=2686017 RepID=A0A845BSW3_9NEIS|nr:NUDIX hydrolase [Craterilacuibacter sinensis]MXR38294.1 NUDIX domain-containing protein [Craterilacuibacter sinensis]
MTERFKPNTTVAAIIERDGRFLLVEEQTTQGVRYNQPAGHLEAKESLLQAVCREVKEETGYRFTPQGLVGVYLAPGEPTYLRFTFFGTVTATPDDTPLDDGIIAAHWLTLAEITARETQLRSPLVMRCIHDWRQGARYPLALLQTLP